MDRQKVPQFTNLTTRSSHIEGHKARRGPTPEDCGGWHLGAGRCKDTRPRICLLPDGEGSGVQLLATRSHQLGYASFLSARWGALELGTQGTTRFRKKQKKRVTPDSSPNSMQ